MKSVSMLTTPHGRFFARSGSASPCGILGEWRVIYVAKFADAVYVLHAFQKKTQQTRKEDIALATARYKQLKEIAK
jgi:Phage derived protein Gp49-like (DUF891)